MRGALLAFLVLGINSVTGCAKHTPTEEVLFDIDFRQPDPRVQYTADGNVTIDARQPTVDTRPRWDGWMVVDPSTHSIVFLQWNGEGDVVQFDPFIPGEAVSDGQDGYVFQIPYRSPFFQHITITNAGMVVGYWNITDQCWLGISASWYKMQGGDTSLVVVGGVTGNIYHVAIGEGMRVVDAIGQCSEFVKPNTAPPQ